MSIARGIVDIVEKEMAEHAAQKLRAVNIVVGKMAAVASHQLEWWFNIMVSESSAMAGATLNVRVGPLGYRCRECGVEFTAEELALTCPECGAGHPRLTAGTELTIESIEVD
jgi:hydrogenase nickel incorporation protein HypA/HybF